jgi:HlyD family secretion protein
MGVKVTFLRPDADGSVDTQAVTLAPRGAIRTEGDVAVVFVLRGDVVERRAVAIGGLDGDRVEIRAGVQPGDRVVLNPPADLTDGVQVVVQ